MAYSRSIQLRPTQSHHFSTRWTAARIAMKAAFVSVKDVSGSSWRWQSNPTKRRMKPGWHFLVSSGCLQRNWLVGVISLQDDEDDDDRVDSRSLLDTNCHMFKTSPGFVRQLAAIRRVYKACQSSKFSQMSTENDRQKLFLSSAKFAVVGASKDQSKYGTKVLKWYQTRDKYVTPVHPKEDELEGISAVRSLSDLTSPSETSVSIITPPKVTLGILEQAKDLSVRALWLQPGAEDEAVISYIHNNGLEDRVIYGGSCILVEGDGIVRSLL